MLGEKKNTCTRFFWSSCKYLLIYFVLDKQTFMTDINYMYMRNNQITFQFEIIWGNFWNLLQSINCPLQQCSPKLNVKGNYVFPNMNILLLFPHHFRIMKASLINYCSLWLVINVSSVKYDHFTSILSLYILFGYRFT